MSTQFEEFLEFIGTKVTLQGWDGFRGGLDVKTNTTGTHSYYTTCFNTEIMFHVSTLLPFFPYDIQQVERKRHIGNDICAIIFMDGGHSLDLRIFVSEFLHNFAVISPNIEKSKETGFTHYNLLFTSKVEVEACNPILPFPTIFPRNDQFKNFLLTKLLNSERKALQATVFNTKMTRTRKKIIRRYCS